MLALRSASSLAGGAIALSMVVAAATRQPAQQPPPQPTFRTGVSLVRVDVTVTGRNGVPVADLTRDDFVVEEDGIPQMIETFQFVSLDGEVAEGDDTSLVIRSRAHGEAEAARDDVRLFAIFLDDYHITREPRVTLPLRKALTEFVNNEIRPTDVVVLMDPLTPLSALEYTRSKPDVLERIRTFEGRRGIYVPPRSVLEEGQLAARNVRRLRAEVTISALHALVVHLGALRERRTSVLFVSEGPPVWFPDGDVEPRLREVLQAANRFNVTIHVLDPRGLTGGGARDVLWRLSGETGGRSIVNTNSYASGLKQVVRDASAYYLLGYSPARAFVDGKFHRIEVTVRRSGVRTLSRRGYWAPKEEDLAPAPAPTLDPAVRTALDALASLEGGRPAAVWMGFEPSAPGRTRVRFAWQPADPRDLSRGVPARLALRVLDDREQVVAERQLPAGMDPTGSPRDPNAFAFDLPAGPVTMTMTVEDSDGAVLDRWTERVTVPAYASDVVVLGTPYLLAARSALAYRQLSEGAETWAPTPLRDFRRTDRVFTRAAVRVPGDSTAAAGAELLSRRGSGLVTLPAELFGGSVVHVELPLASLAAGDYVLKLAVRAGGGSAEQWIAFRVVP